MGACAHRVRCNLHTHKGNGGGVKEAKVRRVKTDKVAMGREEKGGRGESKIKKGQEQRRGQKRSKRVKNGGGAQKVKKGQERRRSQKGTE